MKTKKRSKNMNIKLFDRLLQADNAMRVATVLANPRTKIGKKLDNCLKIVQKQFNAGRGSIMLLDQKTNELVVRASSAKRLLGHRQPMDGKSVSAGVAKAGKTVNHNSRSKNSKKLMNSYGDYKKSAFISYPIKSNGKVLGVFNLTEKKTGAFSRRDETAMHSLVDRIAVTIENAELVEMLTKKSDDLQEAKVALGRIMDMSADPVLIQIHGVIHYANDACARTLLFDSKEELAGRSIYDFLHPDSHALAARRVALMEAGQKSFPAEDMRLSLKTGEIRDIEISSSVVTYDNQRAMQVSFRDVTRKKIIENELRLAKNQAERATALKDRFVTIVSHDLKAPLASTISMLRLLEKSLSVRQETLDRQLIHRPMAALETMYKMIERLLDISLLQAGAFKIQKRVIDLHDLGAETVSILAPVAEQKGVTIRMGIPKGFRVLADPNLMFEVMNNLVANAIKFSHGGGTVTIDKFSDELACFLVRDTGVGIDFNNIPALLGQENKTSTPGTSGERGTGLGLSFCAEIIKAHGGTMAIDSELGKGSTFRVCLPRMEAKGFSENDPASIRDPKPLDAGSQCCKPSANQHMGQMA